MCRLLQSPSLLFLGYYFSLPCSMWEWPRVILTVAQNKPPSTGDFVLIRRGKGSWVCTNGLWVSARISALQQEKVEDSECFLCVQQSNFPYLASSSPASNSRGNGKMNSTLRAQSARDVTCLSPVLKLMWHMFPWSRQILDLAQGCSNQMWFPERGLLFKLSILWDAGWCVPLPAVKPAVLKVWITRIQIPNSFDSLQSSVA